LGDTGELHVSEIGDYTTRTLWRLLTLIPTNMSNVLIRPYINLPRQSFIYWR
jgi:hypothetical protein